MTERKNRGRGELAVEGNGSLHRQVSKNTDKEFYTKDCSKLGLVQAVTTVFQF